jgi:alpha-glucan,water dikinase
MEPEPTGDADGKWPGAPSGKIGYVVGEILNCEVKASSWTLMHRYHRCKDLLRGGNMDVANRDHVAYLYIWLRYSFSRQLSWQRHYNTRPKELQNAQV